jgi:NAD(P)H-hydrate epimerase
MNIPPDSFFHRQNAANKYDMGHVLVIGGDHGTVGAAFLAGQAALRTGAGLVTIAAPNDIVKNLEASPTAIMTLALPESVSEAITTLKTYIASRSVTVIVLGPGLRPKHAARYLPLLSQVLLPAVIDAGGLVALAEQLRLLRETAKKIPVILTPHAREYQKMTGSAPLKTAAETATAVQQFANENGAMVVFKQYRTIVAAPNRAPYSNSTGNPGLATAGTGDVLAGCIAGVLAQKIPAFDSAVFGTYLQGLAGDKATAANTEPGVTAPDVLQYIPAALQDIVKHRIQVDDH